MLQEYADMMTNFVRAHDHWIFLIVFLLAFIESLAVVSFFFPATIVLFGLGVVVGDLSLPFWWVWLATVSGAFIGLWLSYLFGVLHKDNMNTMWPFGKRPTLYPKVEKFFHKWGLGAVLFCRFFEPLRATIPMMSGAFGVKLNRFQVVNLISSMVWAFGVLAPGGLGISWIKHIIH